MDKKIVVTGAAGFIGYHLCMRLLSEGYQVVGCDNVCSYYPVVVKHQRLAQLKAFGDQFRFVELDLCDYEALIALFAEVKPEMVCNLAAQAGVGNSVRDPFSYQKSNLEGFLNILEACRHHEVSRLVYASSSSVYGGNTKLPFAESDRVDSPISLYAASKKANELMAHSYSHLFGIQTIGLRFFTVYGPWGRPDMAMWIFAEKIMRDQTIPVFNHGKSKRDFTYIDDIVSGVRAALFTPDLAPYEVFNLGNNRVEQLSDMIHTLEDALGRKADLDLLPLQPGDVPATHADVALAKEKLGYIPTTPMSVGLPRFCEWYLAHPDIAEEVATWRQQQS